MVDRTVYDPANMPEMALRQIFGRHEAANQSVQTHCRSKVVDGGSIRHARQHYRSCQASSKDDHRR